MDRILDTVPARVAGAKAKRPLVKLEADARAARTPRDVGRLLSGEGVTLIAEFKRRSPSAGVIRGDADVEKIARDYEAGGAGAISVLTEPQFFDGSLGDLATVAGACSLPVLRKDFIVDAYQVVESRSSGADWVLLIVAALGANLLDELLSACREWLMSALVEVHTKNEAALAVNLGATIIGINQRDLRTFEVDRGLAARLRRAIPDDTLVVAESGIRSRADIEELNAAGIDGVLVGELLMRADDPKQAVTDLLETGA